MIQHIDEKTFVHDADFLHSSSGAIGEMHDLTWWQHAAIYEIYPRSFQDSNGDGIGDLNGILKRMSYLEVLGVDAIWISPIYPSPMADFGYDVEDYCGIDPMFGTMEDFNRLLAEAHRRGLRIILDFVPNHTSDQHPWFLESRSSRDNPKRDWYIWRDQPNNWLSHFGGSAWEFDEKTGQYYLHSFLKEQPDVNWRNPAVKAAMFDALRFWLRKGVDGFRVDVMWLMIKDDQFRDNPPNPGYRLGQPPHHRLLPIYNSDRPDIHDLVAEMRGVVDEFPDRVLIGEIYLPIPQLMMYYGVDLQGANLPFNFQLLQCAWSASAVAEVISEYQQALPDGAWPNWVLGNHDNARIASRIGTRQARVAAMLLLTLPGTITMYYGEELGMCNVPIAPYQVQDPAEKNEPGLGLGRDPERTPMPWDRSPAGGFTTGWPWLPLGDEHEIVNVAALERDDNSILRLYRSLIQLRQTHLVLVSGKLEGVAAEKNALRYERACDLHPTNKEPFAGTPVLHPTNEDPFAGTPVRKRLLILLNMAPEAVLVSAKPGTVLISTHLDREGAKVGGHVELRAAEGLIVSVD